MGCLNYDIRKLLNETFFLDELKNNYRFDDFIDYYDFEDCEEERMKDEQHQ